VVIIILGFIDYCCTVLYCTHTQYTVRRNIRAAAGITLSSPDSTSETEKNAGFHDAISAPTSSFWTHDSGHVWQIHHTFVPMVPYHDLRALGRNI